MLFCRSTLCRPLSVVPVLLCEIPSSEQVILYTGTPLYRSFSIQVFLFAGPLYRLQRSFPIQVLLYTGPPDLFTGNSLNRSFSLQVPLYIQVLLYTDPPLDRPFSKSLLLCIAPSLHRSYFPHSNQPCFIIVFLFTGALLHRLFL